MAVLPSDITVLILNLGSQDLLISDPSATKNDPAWLPAGGKLAAPVLPDQPSESLKGLRARARFYRDMPPASRPELRFPLLEPAVEAIRKNGPIDLVILAATDQPGTESKSSNDTIELAYLVKEWLLSDPELCPSEVEIIRFVDRPHLVHSAMARAHQELDRVLKDRPGRIARAYFSLSGGIPAVNIALLWESMQRFRTNGNFFQVVEPPPEALERGEPSSDVRMFPLNQFLVPFTVARVEEAMERHEWSHALKLVRESKSVLPKRTPFEVIEKLLEAAAARRVLDMHRAGRLATEACHEPCCSDREWEQVALDLRFSSNVKLMDQMLEHLTEIDMLLGREQYADILWRIYGLGDVILGSGERAGWAAEFAGNPAADEIRARMEKLNPLRTLRNNVVHQLDTADRAAIERYLSYSGLSLNGLIPFLSDTLKLMAKVEGVQFRPVDYKRFRQKVRELLPG